MWAPVGGWAEAKAEASPRRGPVAGLAALVLFAGAVAAIPPAAGAQEPQTIASDTGGGDSDGGEIGADGSDASGDGDGGAFTLVVLHNNDGESKLLPDPEAGFPGVARFAALMKELRAEATGAADGVVTLTSGDNFLPSRELGVSLERAGPLYDSTALSGLYDAMGLGNHDFDLGPEVTARFIGGFDPPTPFVAANLDFSAEPALQALVDDGRLAASAVVEAGGQPIGVIGAVTPQLPNISSPRRVAVSAVLAAVTAEVESLTARDVDKIILVSHLQDVAAEMALIPRLAGVDAVIAGGGDDLLRNPGDTCMPTAEPVGVYPILVADSEGVEVPLVTAPGGYRCIGALTVVFDAAGRVTEATGRSVGVGAEVAPDPGVQAAVVEPLAEAVAEADSQVIGVARVDLDGRRGVVRTVATNQGNLHADALRAAAADLWRSAGAPAPDVAVQNGGGIRNDAVLRAGPVTVGHTWDIAPFGNLVVVGEVPRETFRVLLEQAVDRAPRAAGHFAQVSGFAFAYDPSGPARAIDRDGDCSVSGHPGGRVRDVVLDDGTVIVADGAVVPGDPVVLATVDFLADGGDCYPLADLPFTKLGITDQQALANYVSTHLDGVISADRYPPGGGSRITALDSDDDEPEADEPGAEDPGAGETGARDNEAESGTGEPGVDEPGAEDTEPGETRRVTVTPGDNLWGIAAAHLGTGTRWQQIFSLNAGRAQDDGRRLADPNLILPGWVLELPPD